jgi:hypothetical protein
MVKEIEVIKQSRRSESIMRSNDKMMAPLLNRSSSSGVLQELAKGVLK